MSYRIRIPYRDPSDSIAEAWTVHSFGFSSGDRAAPAISTKGAPMQRLKLKATVTETDRGKFTAIAVAYTTDRQRERIAPGASRALAPRL